MVVGVGGGVRGRVGAGIVGGDGNGIGMVVVATVLASTSGH